MFIYKWRKNILYLFKIYPKHKKSMLQITIDKEIAIASFKNVSRFNYIISQEVKDQLNTIMKKNGAKLILNMQGLEFIDSSAIGTLISVLKTSKENRGTFYLCNLSPEVNDLLEVMQLQTVFDIYSTLDEAISKI